jgi:hypothetical protein
MTAPSYHGFSVLGLRALQYSWIHLRLLMALFTISVAIIANIESTGATTFA